MIPWNALPWNTIAIIIGLSLLLPSLLTILFIKKRRFEDLGMVIGVFLIILSSVSYFYLIPNEIVDNAMLPEDYVWEDTGDIQYWERNSVFPHDRSGTYTPFEIQKLVAKRPPIEKNFTGKEIIHAAHFDSNEKEMIIHDAIYDENGEIFRVINRNEEVSEWYRIDPYLSSLKYVSVDAGHMGIPSNLGGAHSIQMGWVESTGEKDGEESIVLLRDMQKIKTGYIDGVEVTVWQSDIYNKPITWHGESYICDETLRLTVNPKTGYIVNVYRHLLLSAHLSKFIELYYPDTLRFRSVVNYLKLNDPIGEAAELTYETTAKSQDGHIAEVKALQGQMIYIPMAICVPLFLIGTALTWRYCGRSYYWKRYKNFDDGFISLQDSTRHKNKPLKTAVIFLIAGVTLISSIGYIVHIEDGNQKGDELVFDDKPLSFEEEPPTPPGSNRAIDSGRHTLQPLDESIHKLARREWWYFNVFFNDPNSELKNWSMVISFNKMAFNDIRFLKRDNFFTLLFDDKGVSHNFGMLDQPRGTLQMNGPGVDIKFGKNWAKGQYPTWQVHSQNDVNDFTADLEFTADFMPVWVMGRSSNLAIFRYFGGDYYIPRCMVNGTISWKNKEYRVCGVGYHDHVWQTGVPRFVTKGWEWFNLHFDNGWEMYISKFIFRTPRNLYAAALIISPDNRNLVEYTLFSVDVVEEASPKELPSLKYPKKYRIEAKRDDTILKLDIEIYNTCELVWKKARTGMFEGPCHATGTFSWANNTVELNGYGMSEITRVKYLLELPGIFMKKGAKALPRLFL